MKPIKSLEFKKFEIKMESNSAGNQYQANSEENLISSLQESVMLGTDKKYKVFPKYIENYFLSKSSNQYVFDYNRKTK